MSRCKLPAGPAPAVEGQTDPIAASQEHSTRLFDFPAEDPSRELFTQIVPGSFITDQHGLPADQDSNIA